MSNEFRGIWYSESLIETDEGDMVSMHDLSDFTLSELASASYENEGDKLRILGEKKREYNGSHDRSLGRAAALGVLCGDCNIEVFRGESCSHLRVGPRGGIYHSDDPRFLDRPKKDDK